jgi:hypothetical protein
MEYDQELTERSQLAEGVDFFTSMGIDHDTIKRMK